MKFRGLFMGIDRYANARIPWLGGAARDAAALHALFSDSLGDSAKLLIDEAATTGAIQLALSDLARDSTSEDVVVVAFSGHGSEDHHLVAYDADPDKLADSSLSLEELGSAIGAIPGKTLLCILDCCFSGGLGARVLTPELRARASATGSVADLIDRFTGEGRLVLTASAEDEEAHESLRHRHGLLSYRLLEALQGAPEVCEGESISLYKLVEHVTRTVQADAAQMGRTQTPTLRGKLDGAPGWPVLAPGARYAALFPDRTRPPATEDVASLLPHGLTQPVIDAWSGVVPRLNSLQLAAINDYGVLAGENVIVTAPTSSGKTMIGEFAALRSALLRGRAIFLLPMRALVNDKFEHFTRVYGAAGLKTIRATGEHSDDVPAFLRGQFDIALLTYEKFSALALGNPHVLELAGTVAIDEAQMLADRGRGSNLEFVLTLLNRARGRTGSPQIVTLSAVVGALGGLDRWLGGRNLHSIDRPVPLVEGVLDHEGAFRSIDPDGAEQIEDHFVEPLYEAGSRRLLIPLLRRLLDEGKKALVFRQSRGESVACAVYLSRSLGLAPAADAIDELQSGDASTSTQTLRMTLGGGVGFHNSDLDREERRVLEEQFRQPDSALRVLVATPTLAMGVNTPATAVAIVGLTHPGPVPQPYSVAEYKNMVGRAGRLGFTERGESYLIPEGALDARRGWDGYVAGSLEDLRSQLVPDGDPRSLMLRVLAAYPSDATGAVTEDDVIGFLDSSFAAFQAREAATSAQWDVAGLRRAFTQLTAARLIEESEAGYHLTELGRFTGESGVHVDSILRLVHVLRGAPTLNSVGLIAAAQLTNELDEIFMPANARGRHTEFPRWPGVLSQQGVPGAVINGLQNTAQEAIQAVRRSKRAAAAASWIAGIPMQQIELDLTRHMRQRGGVAGAVRATADRARDLLPAVAAVMRALTPDQPADELVARTMVRLELGVPAELVELITTTGVEMPRSQWLQLHGAGLSSASAVAAADISTLTNLAGSATQAQELHDAAARSPKVPNPEPLVLPAPVE